MADVIFYEKTGCAGNARQKALLIAAGHQVESRDLRQHFWSNLRLLEFLADSAGRAVVQPLGTCDQVR
jgi:hypothetical protein